jgi:hypothetical protein
MGFSLALLTADRLPGSPCGCCCYWQFQVLVAGAARRPGSAVLAALQLPMVPPPLPGVPAAGRGWRLPCTPPGPAAAAGAGPTAGRPGQGPGGGVDRRGEAHVCMVIRGHACMLVYILQVPMQGA